MLERKLGKNWNYKKIFAISCNLGSIKPDVYPGLYSGDQWLK